MNRTLQARALAKAKGRFQTLSAEVRRLLVDYVAEQERS